MFPISQASGDFTTPWGVANSTVKGTGTVQVGPLGVSTSVPWAPGFSATPANTINGLGLASPFATTSEFLHNITPNSFGQTNPFSPLIGTPYEQNPDLIMATGAFGGLQNSNSIFTGTSIPFASDGSFGFGGPGGSRGGSMMDSVNFGGLGMADFGSNGVPMTAMGGMPQMASSIPLAQMPTGGIPGMGAAPQMPLAPSGGMGTPMPQMAFDPSGGMGMPVGGAMPNTMMAGQFNNPNLFAPVPSNAMSGVAQSVATGGGDFASRYNVISDGVSKLFMQGQADPRMPRQAWGSGSRLISPFGTFETGVGWAGGNANAGLLGTQASGMAWAKVSPAHNPGMTISYSNPYYNNFNFNQGFSNA